jgi:hypothetical protein
LALFFPEAKQLAQFFFTHFKGSSKLKISNSTIQ